MPKDNPNELARSLLNRLADDLMEVVGLIQNEENELVQAAAKMRDGDMIGAHVHLNAAQRAHLGRGPIHNRSEKLQDMLAVIDPEYDEQYTRVVVEESIANDTLEQTQRRLANHNMSCEDGPDCVVKKVYEERIKAKS